MLHMIRQEAKIQNVELYKVFDPSSIWEQEQRWNTMTNVSFNNLKDLIGKRNPKGKDDFEESKYFLSEISEEFEE